MHDALLIPPPSVRLSWDAMAISDSTDTDAAWVGHQPLSERFAKLCATAKTVLEGQAGEIASFDSWQTDRGTSFVVIANGVVKPEAEPCLPVVLKADFSADRQYEALKSAMWMSVALAGQMKGDNSRLCWRRDPNVKRWLEADGLHLCFDMRLAWD